MKDRNHRSSSLVRSSGGCIAAAGAAVAAYMLFEAQWVRCVKADLPVPGLPAPWAGISVFHLSDVHAGLFFTNERSLRKAVEWVLPLKPDLVLLTGDVLGDPARSRACLELIARLKPPLGKFAVTGNHEFGIAKGPLARSRHTDHLWARAGVTLLRDRCMPLPERLGTSLVLCGGDYLTGGMGLEPTPTAGRAGAFPVLLLHEPPTPESPLADRYPLAFCGHTHGGQIRIPTTRGLAPLNSDDAVHLAGVYRWGRGRLVVSTGIGTSFVPMRLLTRPEAVLWRLV